MLIYVDHKNKLIIPVDLKTSSHFEDEFYKSFIDWNYQIQARNYARIIRKTLDEDEYFKDFKMLNYHFVVVNRKSLIPLVWEFKDTYTTGTLYYGKNKQYVLRDPSDIARDLLDYYETHAVVQKNVAIDKPNDIIDFLNKQ